MRGPAVVGRLLEGASLLVPLGAIGPQRLAALRGARLVEPREWDRLAAGVDAVHQIFVGRQLRLTTQQYQRLNPRARSRRSSLANLHVVGIPVSPVVAALVEPFAIVIEALGFSDVVPEVTGRPAYH